ncbi:recombination directionality factor [Streptomyces tsukubensis]|uniref:recombination directionality factor n=1 Tax=Streptomyces tsukubensis TaxID=83656 RepID=UPI00344EC79E
MGLRIFETDPNAKPRQRENDTVGRFRTGRQINNRPESLATFRVTTGDPEVADAVSKLFGGSPAEWETSGEDFTEVITDRDKVLIVIDGASSLKFDMRLYGRTGLIHHCDGVDSLLNEDKGQPCGCPTLLEDRKAFAKSGRGPQPYTFINGFRIADDYGLGKFRLQTTSWTILPYLDQYWADLGNIDGEALAELSLELVEYTTKTGRDVSYRRPALKIIKPWSEAMTDNADTDY